ncbi:MAG TPA: hypothetical protein VGO78_14940 [Acidimicrobiales bacterium]|jgi:hypothetical protein|nr:hypothetical protein [Acidimicrobiales bacterium]
MPHFEVNLRDRTVDVIEDADAYQQEGPMTTFFRCGEGREAIDSWSVRIASLRTADIVAIHRREHYASQGIAEPLQLSLSA